MSKKLHIVHLYPNEMNTYGDRGNIITLTRRAEWHGLQPVVEYHHPGTAFPRRADLVFGGGGQDSAQSNIQEDILVIGNELHKLANAGVPMLTICGTYQLFGHKFVTHQKQDIKGISIFDLETHATKHRLIGNLAVEADDFGVLYGFENHSGQTHLAAGQPPLGQVTRGNGNNERDKHEGARVHNVLGTYMHGPVLPLNPHLADWLIETAYSMAYGAELASTSVDNHYATMARAAAKDRHY